MRSIQIIGSNLEKIYTLTGLNSAQLCLIAKTNGIALTPSTLSRFLNGGNTTLETLDSLIECFKYLPGCEWIEQSHLLTPNAFLAQECSKRISSHALAEHYRTLFTELNSIGWVKFTSESNMQPIVDISVHIFRKSGFEISD